METNQKISVGNVQRATIEVSNLNDETRAFDITATADVNSNGTADNINSGVVKEIGSETNLASFNAYSENMSLTLYKAANRCAIMEAVDAFINDTKEHSFNL